MLDPDKVLDITLIEVIGIPYAGKTTFCQNLYSEINRNIKKKGLRKHGLIVEYIEEYRGDREFYAVAKGGIELNLARIRWINERLFDVINNYNEGVVIIDRGYLDAMAWVDFFVEDAEKNSLTKSMIDKDRKKIMEVVGYYYTFWLSIDPMIAVARSNKVGKIVNITNMIRLDKIYEDLFLKNRDSGKFKKIRAENINIQDVALCATKRIFP